MYLPLKTLLTGQKHTEQKHTVRGKDLITNVDHHAGVGRSTQKGAYALQPAS